MAVLMRILAEHGYGRLSLVPDKAIDLQAQGLRKKNDYLFHEARDVICDRLLSSSLFLKSFTFTICRAVVAFALRNSWVDWSVNIRMLVMQTRSYQPDS